MPEQKTNKVDILSFSWDDLLGFIGEVKKSGGEDMQEALSEAFDDLVHDIACANAVSSNPHHPDNAEDEYDRYMDCASNAASAINNGGMDAQLEFLKQHLNPLEIVQRLGCEVEVADGEETPAEPSTQDPWESWRHSQSK